MTVHPLPDDDRDDMQISVSGRYLHGDCYSMAIALHRLTGWPLVVAATPKGDMVHAGVRRPDGMIFDVRGAVTPKKFQEDWACAGADHIDGVTEDVLIERDPRWMDHRIRWADQIIESIFPTLLGGQRQERLEAFLQDLHALCMRHGYYIREPYPAAKPVVYEAYGDEAGFDAERLMVGGWSLTRKLI